MQDIKRQIKSGELAPGSFLPSERELCARHGVSRITVRRAIAELVKEGVLRSEHGRGAWIVQQDPVQAGGNARRLALIFKEQQIATASNPYVLKRIRGITEICNARGYTLSVSALVDLSARPDGEEAFKSQLAELGAGGILVDREFRERELQLLRESGMPFVWLGQNIPGEEMNCVTVDGLSRAKQVFDYLVGLGHRRIAMVNGPLSSMNSQLANMAYELLCEHYSLGFDERLLKNGNWTEDFGTAATEELLSVVPRPTAIVYVDDISAVAGIRVILKRGLEVPADVSVIGSGNMGLDALAPMPLTTVEENIEEVARVGAQMLIDILEGAPVSKRKVVIKPRLLVKASSGPCRGTDG